MIYLFSTKWATDQFIQGFAKKQKHKFFPSAEKPGPNDSIAADRFYRFHWPEWDGKLENVEVAFQGIIRNTHELYQKCLETKTKFYYFLVSYYHFHCLALGSVQTFLKKRQSVGSRLWQTGC